MSTLTTDRLVLRPFREGDAKMMYHNWTSDENVARYCHWQKHENLNTTIWLLQMYLDEAASGFEFRWAITEKGNDEPIGAIDVVGIADNEKRLKSVMCFTKSIGRRVMLLKLTKQ